MSLEVWEQICQLLIRAPAAVDWPLDGVSCVLSAHSYLSVITGQAALESRIYGPEELPGLQISCSSDLGRICSEWEGEGTPLTQEVSSDHKVPCPRGGHADLEVET